MRTLTRIAERPGPANPPFGVEYQRHGYSTSANGLPASTPQLRPTLIQETDFSGGTSYLSFTPCKECPNKAETVYRPPCG
jgi:hypothetical protein